MQGIVHGSVLAPTSRRHLGGTQVISDATELAPRIQSALGVGYVMGRELGGGGMSRVFLVRDLRLERDIVVKVLSPEVAGTLSAERFERELRIAARLQHPNIVPVLLAGSSEGLPYYTMPFVRGDSLRARLNAAVMPLRVALRALGDVAHALSYAHGEGVIHRDIKPENVLMVGEIAVVTDFGIGKAIAAASGSRPGNDSGQDVHPGALTQLGMAVGTPAYMAPEQAAGDPDVDLRVDLYAWAVLAYECLTGTHPFGKRTAQGYVAAHMVEAPTPVSERNPAIPHPVATVIMRCLEKERDRRPDSARDIIDALERGRDLSSMPHSPRPPAGEREDAAGESITPSIAVLPFVNLSADAENEYFSDGITEEIRNLLAKDRTLRVAARSSSFAFKGKVVDPRAVAEQLQVRTVLEGSIRRAGNQVRIAAQLVNAGNGYQLWSDRFDRELTDIFAVQDEIAAAIAKTLRPVLRESAVEASSAHRDTRKYLKRMRYTRYPVAPEAYDAVLKGRHLNHRRSRGDGDIQEAITHFRRALELEPLFGPALAGLAESFLWLCILFVLPPTEAFAQARRYARDALDADPDLATAHYVLGEIAFWHDWDAAECERHVRRALELDPNNPEALLLLARLHLVRGERGAMQEAMDAAVRADPLGYGTRWYYVVLLYLAGAFDRAAAEADRLLAEAPDFADARRWRGKARCLLGDFERGLDDLQRTSEVAPPHAWLLGELSIALSANGRRDEAAKIRDELVERSEHGWIPPTAIVLTELALKDRNAALRWCERALQTRDFLCAMFPFEGMFRVPLAGEESAIVDDPRWIDLQRRVGMAQ